MHYVNCKSDKLRHISDGELEIHCLIPNVMVQAEHDVAIQDTDRLEGRAALVNNVKAAVALAGAVRSTLGPRGLDKMLVDSDGGSLVTNDGVTVIETAKVEHPTARLLISCLLYTSPSPRDAESSRMPSSA